MPLRLNKSKLDVREKTRSSIFNWRGQFTPQFIEYLLQELSSPTDIILDPFCGSGTVLKEAAVLNLKAYGLEINPAAYAMSKFFVFSNIKEVDRVRLFDSFEKDFKKLISSNNQINSYFTKEIKKTDNGHLINLSKIVFKHICEKNKRLLGLLTLFFIEDSCNGSLSLAIDKALHTLKKHLITLPYSTNEIHAELRDARLAHELLQSKINTIITSPPYINVFNYHQNHRRIIENFNFNILTVAQSEIGSNRKNRGNRYKTVIQYCLDMEQSIHSFAQCLKPSGYLIMVMGRESRVRGVPFSNSMIVKETIESLGCFSFAKSYERVFLNRFGKNIFEDILIFSRKTCAPQPTQHGHAIASKHLKQALKDAPKDTINDIEMALESALSTPPSPFLKGKETI